MHDAALHPLHHLGGILVLEVPEVHPANEFGGGMTTAQIIGTVFGAFSALTFLCVFFHECGYAKGYEAGHDSGEAYGRKAEVEWLIAVEQQTCEMRERLWREEAS